jgi:hypothetical protein
VTISSIYKALPPGYKRKCFLAKYYVVIQEAREEERET